MESLASANTAWTEGRGLLPAPACPPAPQMDSEEPVRKSEVQGHPWKDQRNTLATQGVETQPSLPFPFLLLYSVFVSIAFIFHEVRQGTWGPEAEGNPQRKERARRPRQGSRCPLPGPTQSTQLCETELTSRVPRLHVGPFSSRPERKRFRTELMWL